MIAALPMYDRPELRGETDALWAGIRDRLRAQGIAAPDRLTRDKPIWEIWQAPDLVFSQTCGLPYRARLTGRVALIGAPDHGLGLAGHYHSVIVSRHAPLPQLPRLAVNDALSQSGWANLQSWLETRGQRHGPIRMTGAHRASARAVCTEKADLAAIDAVSWAQMTRFDPWAAELRVLDQTPPLPALPYIAAKGADIAAYRSAISAAIAGLSASARDALHIRALAPLSSRDYTDLPLPPPPPK